MQEEMYEERYEEEIEYRIESKGNIHVDENGYYIPRELCQCKELSIADKWILILIITKLVDEEVEKMHIPMGYLVDNSGVTERTVLNCITKLSKKGFVTVDTISKGYNAYSTPNFWENPYTVISDILEGHREDILEAMEYMKPVVVSINKTLKSYLKSKGYKELAEKYLKSKKPCFSVDIRSEVETLFNALYQAEYPDIFDLVCAKKVICRGGN